MAKTLDKVNRGVGTEAISVADLRRDDGLGRDIAGLICLKGNNQIERTETQRSYIRERERRMGQEAFLGRTQVPREPSSGKIAAFHFREDVVPGYDELEASEHLQDLWEPHQVSFQDGYLVVVDNTRVLFIDREGELTSVTSPWFRSLHSAQLLSNGHASGTVLVSSAGIDAVLLCDMNASTATVLTWWSALNIPGSVTRSGRRFRWSAGGELHEYDAVGRLIGVTELDDIHIAGLANGDRVLGINDAQLVSNDIWVTTFHAGQVAHVVPGIEDSYVPVADGFRQPHSLVTGDGSIRSIVSSSAGIFYYLGRSANCAFHFANVDGKEPEDAGREWLQSATRIGNDLYAVVDVNRRQITLLDVHARSYRHVTYDPNLAIQMVARDRFRDQRSWK